jgi:pyridoxamine 5'-phosphate oxidase
MSNDDMSKGPLHDDPFTWFGQWLSEAEATGMTDPNACTIATVGRDDQPSARIVLLKEWDERGFVFYTNLRSRKGREALGHGNASMSFFWRDLGRQVRIEGPVLQVPDARADAYFATRPRGSQIGAWASNQSRPLTSRAELIARTRSFEEQFEGKDVPRPKHWSGIMIVPSYFEFWQAGEFRLHDRFVFTPSPHGDVPWDIERLNP